LLASRMTSPSDSLKRRNLSLGLFTQIFHLTRLSSKIEGHFGLKGTVA
jgi:hypothetical protein